ncbi:transcription antitermination factor NusB [Anaerostipes sp. MSJ-23]|uniref:transcription antitermination factor NusB n=1 Tax=Anaerostipes sp. MSJ-23 TaxID=2841520 RepID=UPI001C11037A|nr:transcription antitermination factor NusB [Anaerostipes sp. MSJ-23]MBU5460955.1 transcription antitermination factor NusB [Anaerostipes sp. MSJ-23]
MTRSEVREHIFRILFCVEFCEKDEFKDQVELYFQGHEKIRTKQKKEIFEKVTDLIEHLDQIDEQIEAHTKAWNLTRLGKAELSILRVAVYEILFDEKVPRKVAINEAVELAKKYCNEKAAPFINGILSKIGTDEDEK